MDPTEDYMAGNITNLLILLLLLARPAHDTNK